ncbi:Molybdate transporter [Trichinella pseudospiralis]
MERLLVAIILSEGCQSAFTTLKYTNYQCSTSKKSSNHFHCRGQGFFNVEDKVIYQRPRTEKNLHLYKTRN